VVGSARHELPGHPHHRSEGLMAAVPTVSVPSVSQVLKVEHIRLSGLSGQEWWGRWTLGRQANIDFILPAPTALRLEVEGYMAQHDQTLNVSPEPHWPGLPTAISGATCNLAR
jgi:hypothetical protein